jgi:hypothetical protein
MFSLFNNRPSGATRGRPWLTEVLDYIDIHDELIWAQVEREKLLKLFIVDVEAKDVTDRATGQARLKEMGLDKPPKNPITVIHNDKVKIKLEAPETSGLPAQQLEQILRSNIYGAKGLPEHWSGAGGGANFATARAQDVVPLRRLRRKQRQFISFFRTVISVSLEFRREASSINVKKDPEFDLTYLEVGGRDRQRGATIMKDLMVALSQAVMNQILEPKAANEILLQAADEGGFYISPEHRETPEQSMNDDDVNDMSSRLQSTIAAKKRKTSRGNEQDGEDPIDRREQRASAK